MKLERTPFERSEEGLLRESFRTGDDVHVEERVAFEVSHLSVQPLVEVLEVVPKASERLEIDTRQVQMPIQYRVPLAAGHRIEDAIDVGRVDEEVVKVKEHLDH